MNWGTKSRSRGGRSPLRDRPVRPVSQRFFPHRHAETEPVGGFGVVAPTVFGRRSSPLDEVLARPAINRSFRWEPLHGTSAVLSSNAKQTRQDEEVVL